MIIRTEGTRKNVDKLELYTFFIAPFVPIGATGGKFFEICLPFWYGCCLCCYRNIFSLWILGLYPFVRSMGGGHPHAQA